MEADGWHVIANRTSRTFATPDSQLRFFTTNSTRTTHHPPPRTHPRPSSRSVPIYTRVICSIRHPPSKPLPAPRSPPPSPCRILIAKLRAFSAPGRRCTRWSRIGYVTSRNLSNMRAPRTRSASAYTNRTNDRATRFLPESTRSPSANLRPNTATPRVDHSTCPRFFWFFKVSSGG